MKIKRVDNKLMTIRVKKGQKLHQQARKEIESKHSALKHIHGKQMYVKPNTQKVYRKDCKKRNYVKIRGQYTSKIQNVKNLHELSKEQEFIHIKYHKDLKRKQSSKNKRDLLETAGYMGSKKTIQQLDGGKEIDDAVTLLHDIGQSVKSISSLSSSGIKGARRFHKFYIKRKLKRKISSKIKKVSNQSQQSNESPVKEKVKQIYQRATKIKKSQNTQRLNVKSGNVSNPQSRWRSKHSLKIYSLRNRMLGTFLEKKQMEEKENTSKVSLKTLFFLKNNKLIK